MCYQRYSVSSQVLTSVFFTYSFFSLGLLYILTLLNIPRFLDRSFSQGFHSPLVPWFASYVPDLLSLISSMNCIFFPNYLVQTVPQRLVSAHLSLQLSLTILDMPVVSSVIFQRMAFHLHYLSSFVVFV